MSIKKSNREYDFNKIEWRKKYMYDWLRIHNQFKKFQN